MNTDGFIHAVGNGWGPGKGPSPGVPNDAGGSGGSHGGLGGRGTATTWAAHAYDDARSPVEFGSGGSTVSGTVIVNPYSLYSDC